MSSSDWGHSIPWRSCLVHPLLSLAFSSRLTSCKPNVVPHYLSALPSSISSATTNPGIVPLLGHKSTIIIGCILPNPYPPLSPHPQHLHLAPTRATPLSSHPELLPIPLSSHPELLSIPLSSHPELLSIPLSSHPELLSIPLSSHPELLSICIIPIIGSFACTIS